MEKYFLDRIKKLQDFILKKQSFGFLVSNWANIFYLTGFRGVSKDERESYFFVTKDDFFGIFPKLYEEEARKNLPKENIIIPNAGTGMIESLDQKIGLANKKIFFESQDLKFFEYKTIKSKYKPKLLAENSYFTKVRSTKDSFEIEKLKNSAKANDEMFSQIQKFLRIGVTEIQIKNEILDITRSFPNSEPSFDPIVAFGKGSSVPHYKSSDKIFSKNDLILIDAGVTIDSYVSDMTRVFFPEKPKREIEEIYNLVLLCEEKCVEKLIDGKIKDLAKLHEFAEKMLGNFSKNFIHSLGHGIGIEIHEYPIIYKTVKSKTVFGNSITIEPGVYFPNEFGIRIEDSGIVTKNGFEILSKFPKKLDEMILN